jgi:tyrosyl-tRNA synthetase
MINSELKLLYTDESKIHSATVADFMVKSGICKSKREARDMHKAGGLYINKQRIPTEITHIIYITNAVWDIPNKALMPYYLVTEEEYEQILKQGGI